MAKISRKIVAIGGGEIVPKVPWDIGTEGIDREIVRLAGKKNPKLLFIPTASHDASGYVENVRKHFWDVLGCEVDVLLLYWTVPLKAELEAKILSADIVYVGWWNTYRMMRMWHRYGVDVLLRKAWENGVVMSGLSAGSICWFRHGHSDSRKGAPEDKKFKFMKVSGLSFVPMLHCPHYDAEEYRRPELHAMMASTSGNAIAIDNCAAIEIIDDQYRIITTRAEAQAYLVRKKDGRVVETVIPQREELHPLSELLQK